MSIGVGSEGLRHHNQVIAGDLLVLRIEGITCFNPSMFFLTSTQRMASSLLATFAAAILAGVGAGFLRGTALMPALPAPAHLPMPPIHQMVIIPYESPEQVSAQLHRMAKAKEIEQCLKNESTLVPFGDFFIPIPPPKHHHLLQNYHRKHQNTTNTSQLV